MKEVSPHAEAAKMIRQRLKKQFPNTKFSVSSTSYSGGNSVRISWIDGPTTNSVAQITGDFQYGNFNGMTDSYEYTNTNNNIPQVKFVFNSREYSEQIQIKLFEEMRNTYCGWEHLKNLDESCEKLMSKWNFWTAREYIRQQVLQKQDLTNCAA